MSDSLDKFVLQYNVNIADAVKRLEQLNAKVDSVDKASSKSQKQFKEFANGAADELSKIVPGLDKVTAATRLMGAQFVAVSAAVAALGAGIAAVMALRERYNAQRIEGRESGVSAFRIEEYQRKFVKQGGGYVSRQKVTDEVQKLRQKLGEAYSDPTRQGMAARQFRMMGVDVGAPGQTPLGTNDALSRIADRFQKMTEAQTQGWARTMGMDPDFALTLRKIGASVGTVTEHSPQEIKNRQDAEEKMSKFNDTLGTMNENLTQMSEVVGQKLLPAFTKLAEATGWLATKVPGAIDASADKVQSTAEGGAHLFTNYLKNLTSPKNPLGILGTLGDMFEDFVRPLEEAKKAKEKGPTPPPTTKEKEKAKEIEKQERDNANKMADALDKQNEDGRQIADKTQLAVNQFAGAVATFSNAIDERQAWAAWAGEVGHSAGLSQSGTRVDATIDPTAPTKYDAIFEKASKATGVPVNLMKRVASVESKFDPNAVSEAGAVGLMQIMPSNNKGLGITDARDPEQNIMGGAKLLKEYLGNSASVREALMKYHGGYDVSKWGARTYAYPGKVLGDAGLTVPDAKRREGTQDEQAGVRGQSRANLQYRNVQANVAAKLGVPLAQIQQNMIGKGDIDFANSQLEGGYMNNISQLQVQLQNALLPVAVKAKIRRDIMDQQSGLSQLRQYGPSIAERAPEGERTQLTLGERAIVINVSGAGNPEAIGKAVFEHIQNGLGDIVNSTATMVKR